MFRGFRVSIKERGGRKPSFVPRHRLVSAPSPSPLRPRSAPLRIAPQHRREDRKTVPRQYTLGTQARTCIWEKRPTYACTKPKRDLRMRLLNPKETYVCLYYTQKRPTYACTRPNTNPLIPEPGAGGEGFHVHLLPLLPLF